MSRDAELIVRAEHHDPFSYLGMHRADGDGQPGLVVRVFLPGCRELAVAELGGGGGRYGARQVHPDGLFEATIAGRQDYFAYELETVDADGTRHRRRDPYSFWPVTSSYDQYLYNEGTHTEAYRFLGAHLQELGGIAGVHFATWAPNATRVSVVGDFNHWDGRRHPMRSMGASGIWELFVPHLGAGALYKLEIRTPGGEILVKCDPYGFGTEAPPRSASRVQDLSFGWSDHEWMASRGQRDWLRQPLAIYEVHPGSWRRVPEAGDRPLNYRELAQQLVEYVLDMGYTHVELLPVTEYPFDGSWGYQVTGYYAPTARFGPPEDFAYFVDHCHRHGIGVIIDWVPGHFPTDGHGLARFDGTCLYEHADPRQGAHPDWGTLVFNFGRNEVRSFVASNAVFWFDRYHVDGLRVDAVASMLYLDYSRRSGEWVPNRFGGRENLEAIELLKSVNTMVYGRFPGAMTIAEESTAWPAVSRPTYAGGLGFGFKWNMGWMHDVLRYMSKEPVHRKHHHSDLTFGMLYAYHENFVLPLSHDEVVHGKGSLLDKMPGDEWQRFANLRLLYAYMYGHPGKKLLFMGGELGVWTEWDYRRSLEWHILEYPRHRGVQSLVRDLNHLYRSRPALHATDSEPTGFEWIDCQDVEQNVLSFLRRGRTPGEELVFACNFSPVVREGYCVGVPRPGPYREVLNTDASLYGGGDVGNAGAVVARPEPWHNQPASTRLVLPPLAIVVLEPA
ncbi:MAG: 1,4-alpha-glucan branching protein GlgB [Gemmatimonadota bacterium]